MIPRFFVGITLVLILVVTSGQVTGYGQLFLTILTLFFAVMTGLVCYNAGQGELATGVGKLKPGVVYETVMSCIMGWPADDEEFHRYAVCVRSIERTGTDEKYFLITVYRNPPSKYFRIDGEDFIPVPDPHVVKT